MMKQMQAGYCCLCHLFYFIKKTSKQTNDKNSLGSTRWLFSEDDEVLEFPESEAGTHHCLFIPLIDTREEQLPWGISCFLVNLVLDLFSEVFRGVCLITALIGNVDVPFRGKVSEMYETSDFSHVLCVVYHSTLKGEWGYWPIILDIQLMYPVR